MTTCTWYAVDYLTATGPASYVPYNGYSAALAATAGFALPGVVWGSPSADWNQDNSANSVSISITPGFATWQVGRTVQGGPLAPVMSGFATANDALAAAIATLALPSDFCVESTLDLCNPADLVRAAKCFQCIPKGNLGQINLLLACIWAGGTTTPESFLVQSDNGDFITLDDGGRIILN